MHRRKVAAGEHKATKVNPKVFEEVRKGWKDWDQKRASTQASYEITVKKLLQFSNAHPVEKILSIGTIAATGLPVDSKIHTVDIGKLSTEFPMPRTQHTRGDALRLPFKDNTFGLVTSSFTMAYVGGRKKFAEEFYRVMKPGGEGLLILHCPASGLVRLAEIAHKRLSDKGVGDDLIMKNPFLQLGQLKGNMFANKEEAAVFFSEVGFEVVSVSRVSSKQEQFHGELEGWEVRLRKPENKKPA